MKNTFIYSTLGLVSVCAAGIGSGTAEAATATQTAARKAVRKTHKPVNFIVINLDDAGYGDFGTNGATGYTTPNIDKMAADGMKFTRFYAVQAVSGASRAGLLTGCYPNRIGMSGAPDHMANHGISDGEQTIAQLLKQRGYSTAIFGKWHLGHRQQFLPLQHGFDEYYGIPYSNDMWPNHPTGKNYYPDLPLIEGNKIIEYNPDQTRFTTDFTNRALGFIDKNKDKPFFIYLAHPMPHVPLFVSDKFLGKSKQGLHGDVMMELDWSVGQIIQKLDREGIAENTLVILTSDNGPWLNYGNHAGSTGGLREGKGVSFEGGQRVPCIMLWRGTVPSGTTCPQLASNIDILPTIAQISTASLPDHKIDGVSLLPVLQGDVNATPRTSLYYYYRKNSLEAVTDRRYKMVFPHKYRSYEGFLPGRDGQPGQVEEFRELRDTLVFDLIRDPGERYNIKGVDLTVERKLLDIAAQAKRELGDDISGVTGTGLRPHGVYRHPEIVGGGL